MSKHLSMSDAAQLLDELRHGRLVVLAWAHQAPRNSAAFRALNSLDHAILSAADEISGQKGFLRNRLDKVSASKFS